MNWDDLRHFAALASAGSLSAAARTLGVEHATVARRVVALEQALGVTLVDRRKRRWALTADGERIAQIAERMVGEALAARRAAESARSELAGTLTISAPPMIAVQYLTAPLVALQARHPALVIRLVGEARTASLERGEAEIAIRLSRPLGGDLTITKLGTIAFRLYASPAYLATTKEADWRFVGYDVLQGRAPQQAALEEYAAGRLFSLHASSIEIQLAATRAGAGIAALPDFMARADPGLKPVSAGAPLLSREVWLVVHSDLKRSALVRTAVQTIKRDVALSLSAAIDS